MERHKKTEESLKGQMQKQNKIINKMAEQLITPGVIEYFTNLVEKENK